MKRYLVQLRGRLPADIAQRIARLHAFAILHSDRGRTTEAGFQITDSQRPKNEPTKTPTAPSDME